jgi:DNA topoisomerase-1
LQATGRDAKGRKQHRYHPRWREVRDENKFERVLAFAKRCQGFGKKSGGI